MNQLKIALATLNPTVGDLSGNSQKIEAAYRAAAGDGADLVVFSELCLIGYPPEDIVLKGAFQKAAMDQARELALATTDGPGMLIGCCWYNDGVLYNAALLLDQGRIAEVRAKCDLPNYGVFDEIRIFQPGPHARCMEYRGVALGVMICEDMWKPGVSAMLKVDGAELLIVLNGSPFEQDKYPERQKLATLRVSETSLPLIYVNQVGGQDELAFDGGAFVLNREGGLVARSESWRETTLLTTWTRETDVWACAETDIHPAPGGYEALYQAMVTGLRDYVYKNRFPGVVLGMSGGIDSALSAVVAVDALGAENVHLVMMPSKYTSEESLLDAAICAEWLGARIDNIPIDPAVQAFGQMLVGQFAGTEEDTTEENLQSRIRGVTLMAISNKFGHMLLTTGNKSEMSVGYATLYGDMCGGYSVLKDLYKTDVFGISEWRNVNHPAGSLGPKGQVMPQNIISKPPTAELRPDQKDEDSLPPYEVLDDILQCLIEQEMHVDEIVERGHDFDTVARIEHLLYIAEYKRRQAPPGVKLTRRNFGRDRRYPITNGFRNARLKGSKAET
ncbi:NAD+ synthase [Paremcibacter congregatus]|uniref:Glutamine-dependent NAD(+) synthetase n=1 Tax=Paremcibacter congregatus TaxID=2043170 RepID=A0A2G4YXB1_9PROT|nr:NAD+ synthase [Paremcibacter congregatus]PHZ86076.1 NAD+ synthase [Paremcibacter congregatus]QDE27042.1 NAD+ synthase [Paremcibacter congregatus]